MNHHRPRKILIFSAAYHPYVGGAELAIKEITDRIDPREIEFHLITNRFDRNLPRQEQIGNVRVHRIGFAAKNVDVARTHAPRFYLQKMLFPLQAARFARGLNRTHHFDAFWAVMLYMTFPITLLRMLGVTVPYVLTLQEGDAYEHVFNRAHLRPFRPLLRRGIMRAARVQSISAPLLRWVTDLGYSGPTSVIPNGVDVERFTHTHTKAALEETKRELGKREGDVFLVTTSRLVSKNALDDVIRALTHLPAHIHFVVFGSGPLKSELETLARSLGVDARTHFRGEADHEHLPRYLAACDIFIRPSRSEGMGSSFIEAMAAGVPVIATQVGGIRDFLADPKRDPEKTPTGFAVDPNSPEQIARTIEHILAHSAHTKTITENARTLVRTKYDWDHIAAAMHDRVFTPTFGRATSE